MSYNIYNKKTNKEGKSYERIGISGTERDYKIE